MNAHRTLPWLLVVAALGIGCASPAADPDTYEGFRATLDRETFEGGVWIFDGDLPVDSEKRLREVFTVRGLPGVGTWGPTQRRQLRYCVSTEFGTEHDAVAEALDAATEVWESEADVDFHHLPSEDARCDASNETVVFDVRPVWGQPYLARAFFPVTARAQRNLLISLDAFGADSPPLSKVLEHQLGHALGLDHTRIGTALVLCDGEGSAGLMDPSIECAGGEPHDLTDSEAARVRQLYGPPSRTAPPAPTGELRSRDAEGLVAAGMQELLAPVAVEEGSRLLVELSGTGDLDLYVRYGDRPTRHAWDCRPYGPDARERCELEVPAGVSYAFIAVRNPAEASDTQLRVEDYDVHIEHVMPFGATQQVPRVELTFER